MRIFSVHHIIAPSVLPPDRCVRIASILFAAMRQIIESNVKTSDKAVYTEKVYKLADPSVITMPYLSVATATATATATAPSAASTSSNKGGKQPRKSSALERKAGDDDVDADSDPKRIPFPTVIVSRLKEKCVRAFALCSSSRVNRILRGSAYQQSHLRLIGNS